MGKPGLTCRHDVTPRSKCKLCKAEDGKMYRASSTYVDWRKGKNKIEKPLKSTR